MLFHNPPAVQLVNGDRFDAFAYERLVQQGCPLSLLRYVLALEPLPFRLRGGTAYPVLRCVLFAGCVRANVSAYADITVFVSHRSDIKSVKKGVKKYKKVAWAKINFVQVCG